MHENKCYILKCINSFTHFTIWHTLALGVIYLFNIYIPWIVRGKPPLDIGIVNIDINTTTQNVHTI
jgi:hypothetical protein